MSILVSSSNKDHLHLHEITNYEFQNQNDLTVLTKDIQDYLFFQIKQVINSPNIPPNILLENLKSLNKLITEFSYEIGIDLVQKCFSFLSKTPEISFEASNVIINSLRINDSLAISIVQSIRIDSFLQLFSRPFHPWIKALMIFICKNSEISDQFICYGLIDKITTGILNSIKKETILAKIQKEYIISCFEVLESVVCTMKYNDQTMLTLFSIVSSIFNNDKISIDSDMVLSSVNLVVEILNRNSSKTTYSVQMLNELLLISDYILNHLNCSNEQIIDGLLSILINLTKSKYANKLLSLNSFQNLLIYQQQWTNSFFQISAKLFKCISYLIRQNPQSINFFIPYGILEHSIYVFDNGTYHARLDTAIFFIALTSPELWNSAEGFFQKNEIITKMGYLLTTHLSNDFANILLFGLTQLTYNLSHSPVRNEQLIKFFLDPIFQEVFEEISEIDNEIVLISLKQLQFQLCSLIPNYPYKINCE